MTEDRHARFSQRYASGETCPGTAASPRRKSLKCWRYCRPATPWTSAAAPAPCSLICCGTAGARMASTSCSKPDRHRKRETALTSPPTSHRLFRHDVTRLEQLPDLQARLRSHHRYRLRSYDQLAPQSSAYASAIAERLAPGGLVHALRQPSTPRIHRWLGAAAGRARLMAQASICSGNSAAMTSAIGAAASWYKLRKSR